MIRKKHYFNTIESKRARFLNAKAKTNIQKIPEWPKKPLSKQRTDLNGNGHHWPAQTIFVKKFLVDPKSRQPPNPKNSVLHKRSTNKSHPTKTGKLPRKDKTTSKTSVQQNYKWPKPNSISTDKRNGPTQIKPPFSFQIFLVWFCFPLTHSPLTLRNTRLSTGPQDLTRKF